MTPFDEQEHGVLEGPQAYADPPSLAALQGLLDSAMPAPERELVARAYAYASSAHAGQSRASGSPYFSHAAHTAAELARLGLDGATVAAGLLHDVVEDTRHSLEDLRTAFGEETAQLVDGVTKINVRLQDNADEAQAENLRKMMLAMAKDVRVLLIKLSDRLHNMRTLVYLPEAKQRRIAAETLEVYAALANRLGIAQWKWELEDRCMAVLQPLEYAELAAQIAATQGDRSRRLQEARAELQVKLDEAGIQAVIVGRNKHLWSIYQKMLKQHKRFEELYDLVAMRIVTGSIPDCYAVMGIVHSLWTPLPGRVKDFIAIPKSNMYQSLHTTLVGPAGLPLEVQVRTEEMHRTAERGIAAHWRYKEGRSKEERAGQLPFLRNVLEWQKESHDASEFLEQMKIDLYDEEVFVFTPKGEVKMLPKGSTVIDFAYAVHSSVGEQCYGAVVNGKMAPLRHELGSGDIVRVLTSAQHHPNKDWLLYARTSKAKNRIRKSLRGAEKEGETRRGRESVERLLRRAGLKHSDLGRSSHLLEAAKSLHFATVDELFAAVGGKQISARAVVEELKGERQEAPAQRVIADAQSRSSVHQGVEVRGLGGMLVVFARCCAPVQGDPILGYVTVGRGVSIHRADCVNVPDLLRKAERLVEVRWAGQSAEARAVEIEVAAFDRANLMADMLLAIARTTSGAGRPSNLSAASATGLEGGIAQARFTVSVFDLEHLKRLMLNLYQCQGVTSVKRRDRRLKKRPGALVPVAAVPGTHISDHAADNA